MALAESTMIAAIRYLLNESTASFFSDAEIRVWIAQAAGDISSKTLCYETTAGDITLVADQLEYDAPAGLLKPRALTYQKKGLIRILPHQIGHLTHRTSGPPEEYYFLANKIGLWPLPDASIATQTVSVYGAVFTKAIANIPEWYEVPANWYGVMQGLLKDKRYAQAGQLYQMYLNSLAYGRQDLTDQAPDVRADFKQPDFNEILQPGKE
jgi:hypothetical protein